MELKLEKYDELNKHKDNLGIVQRVIQAVMYASVLQFTWEAAQVYLILHRNLIT
ncbi:hypothetical protein A1E_04500 [Rickettsia canadensis str. McKiel]|uniref:Uncharacterized protein n=1 Tax=Rickettsia canadensis (strain McKiel) TaxID=293613 RepID=A8EZP2_RICCK|nr:hypothetical protein A1E_04500 [Rickettsia canadensis str. McKiel]